MDRMRIAIASVASLVLATACSDPPTSVAAPNATSAGATSATGATGATGATDAPAPRKKHEPLEAYTAYDASQDGQAQIAAAQAAAKGNNKRVLVMFGGNWCKWCKALDGTFAANPDVKATLDKSFVLVHVDSDTNGKLNDAWGNPFANGFPVLVVVDADGKKLHVQETGALERDDKTVGHDPDKVLTFLKQWSPS